MSIFRGAGCWLNAHDPATELPSPIDQIEPDHRVNAGQIVAIFRKIKRARQIPLSRQLIPTGSGN